MLKTVNRIVWAFDAEWVPNIELGKRMFGLEDTQEILDRFYKMAGATKERPQPYIKTVYCRLVSISFVQRAVTNSGIDHKLFSLPKLGEQISEERILQRFFRNVAKKSPQLVGYNCLNADVRIIAQRGLAHGLQASAFAHRPEKPWLGMDYFDDRNSDWLIDLLKMVNPGWKDPCSLNAISQACGIPGKLGTDGSNVLDLWLAEDYDKIIAYNETDAITTFLLWLRVAFFAGHLSAEEYQEEQQQFRDYLAELQRPHIDQYLKAWRELKDG